MLLTNPNLDLPLIPEEAALIDWQGKLVDLPDDGEWRYMETFAAHMYLSRQNNQQKEEALYALLATVTSFKMRLDQQPHPFVARIEGNPFPTPTIDVINGSHLLVLKALAVSTQDWYIKARICDVIWCREKRGNVDFARHAISAYVEAAKVLPKKRWGEQVDLLERAVQLARKLGTANDEYKSVILAIETWLDQIENTDEKILAHRLMCILLENNEGDANKYAKRCEKLANIIYTGFGKWEFPRQYLELKALWLKKLGDESGAQQASEAAAETLVKAAEEVWQCKVPELHANALWNLRRAIEAFRKIERKDRANQLHLQYLEWQKESAKHGFGYIRSDKTDVSELVERARNAVRDKPIHDALFVLVTLSGSPRTSDLRSFAEELHLKYPLRAFIPSLLKNAEGKDIAEGVALNQKDPELREAAIIQMMHYQAPRIRTLMVNAFILPAREQILEEHAVRKADLHAILQHSPFVPPGQYYLFVHGLYAGMNGEFDTALALLVPQVENAIRHLLYRAGVVVSALQSGEPQDEISLQQVFGKAEKRAKLVEIFGSEDLVFDLEGLLINRWSGNLRNKIAHGLMTTDEYFSDAAVYFWWLTLRLCCLPVANLYNSQKSDPA